MREARRLELVERRLEPVDEVFGLRAAGRLISEIMAPWVQELGLLVEAVESGRPPGAPQDWLPGAVLRLPFSPKVCRDGGVVTSAAVMALADVAMVVACSAAWSGYRPLTTLDQTTHFLRPFNFDVIADARVVRIGRAATFGRVTIMSAADRRTVGMVSSAHASL